MKSTLHNVAAKRTAVLFGFVALLGVLVFEFRVNAITTFGVEVLIPYVIFLLVMTLLAARFGHWYIPETGIFEAVVVPILLPFTAAAVSGVAYSVGGVLFRLDTPIPATTSFSEVFGFGIYSSIVFLYVSGLALFPAGAIASAILRKQFSHGTARAAV